MDRKEYDLDLHAHNRREKVRREEAEQEERDIRRRMAAEEAAYEERQRISCLALAFRA